MNMESLVDAIGRLRHAGYTSDLAARPDGVLLCRSCDSTCVPGRVVVDDVVRFEGNSDPGDSAILVAIRCGCGHSGLFSSAYGVDVSSEDALALRRLAAVGR